MRLQTWRACALSLVVLALGAPAAFAIQDPGQTGQDDVDARAGDRAAVPAATATARTALDRSLGPQGAVSADPVTGGLREVGRTDGFLTGPSGGDPAAVGLGYVGEHRDAFGLDGADLSQLRLATRQTSQDGVTHLTWRQTVDGIPAYDSALFANVTSDGRLVNAGGAPVHDLRLPSADPPLGPAAARAAAQRDLGVTPDGDPGSLGTDAVRTTRFADGDTASLVTLADPDGDHLAWKLIVAGKNPYIYEMLVDAASGAILRRASMTEFATSASVFRYHPGAAVGGTATSVTFPSGWLPTTPTSLSGPNAHAYADRAAPDGIGGDVDTAPSSGTDFVYPVTDESTPAAGAGQSCPSAFATPCTWDGAYTIGGGAYIPTSRNASVTANQNQVATQVFYFVNTYHDWLASDPINFTASSRDFEGADPVNAEADDYGGLNNANMSTPPDGSSPRMQMYLFNAVNGFPGVNGGDDASVVYHEYTHGLTSRLVGGDGQANGLQARQSQAMGEGWSDWYAMDFLTAQGLVSDGPTPGDVIVGDYVTDNPNTGIRFNALDCPVGSGPPHCPGSTTGGVGGFTFADMGRVSSASGNPYFEVHADGEIWAETLWDLRTALGGATARALITNALRLSPKQPSFLTMRDAILQADLVTGGSHRAAIWQVFANRGMGFGATTTSGNAGRGTASFTTPPVAAAGKPDVQSPAPLGDGDAALEPGEAARVRIPVINPGTTALTNVRATLTTSTAGVVVGTAKASYGTIAALGTGAATAPFAITIPTSVPCATIVALTLTVTSDQGVLLTAPISLPTGGGASVATATDLPKSVTDGSRGSPLATSSLTVAGPGKVGHLRVTVSASHPRVGDLHGWLISPAGTVVNLFEEVGRISLSDGFNAVVLDDDAPTSIQDVPSTDGVVISGTYSPDEPLSALKDEDRAGTWRLRVVDDFTGVTGTFTAWSLSTDQPTCAATGRALPSASTGAVVDQTGTTAVLTGAAVDADGGFEYGTTTDYGTIAPATAHAGDGAMSVAIGGLTPGATYHFRALAVREGTVMALGADQSFVAAAAPATDVPPPAALVPTPPPAAKPAPPIAITKLPTSVGVDAKGRFTFAFTVPATTAKSGVAKGTVTLKSAKALRLGKSRKKTILTAATARFTVPANGKITFRVTLTKAARSYLRAHRTLKVKATIKLGTTTKTVALTLKAQKK